MGISGLGDELYSENSTQEKHLRVVWGHCAAEKVVVVGGGGWLSSAFMVVGLDHRKRKTKQS